MTTIHFERSGGIVGTPLQLELDLNTLPADEAQYLEQLLAKADFFKIPEDSDVQSTPDEFQYIITVEAGNASHTVRCTDTSMPKSLLPLVKELIMLRVTQ